jgi:hypothetical protein
MLARAEKIAQAHGFENVLEYVGKTYPSKYVSILAEADNSMEVLEYCAEIVIEDDDANSHYLETYGEDSPRLDDPWYEYR